MPAYKLILPVISFSSAKPLPPLKVPDEKKSATLVPGDSARLATDRQADDPFAC